MNTSIIEEDRVTQTTTRGILHIFVELLLIKYESIQMDDA
jgi:hypothetical protein